MRYTFLRHLICFLLVLQYCQMPYNFFYIFNNRVSVEDGNTKRTPCIWGVIMTSVLLHAKTSPQTGKNDPDEQNIPIFLFFWTVWRIPCIWVLIQLCCGHSCEGFGAGGSVGRWSIKQVGYLEICGREVGWRSAIFGTMDHRPRRCIPWVAATMPPLLPVITPVYIFPRYMIPSKCRFAVFTVHNPTINAHNGTGCHRFPWHLHYASMGPRSF